MQNAGEIDREPDEDIKIFQNPVGGDNVSCIGTCRHSKLLVLERDVEEA
jgi:hypothetical protein